MAVSFPPNSLVSVRSVLVDQDRTTCPLILVPSRWATATFHLPSFLLDLRVVIGPWLDIKTNLITVLVTDTAIPPLSATQSFLHYVMPTKLSVAEGLPLLFLSSSH